jgi:hypothetical protein
MRARHERRRRPKRLLLLATIALAAGGVVVGPAAAQSTNAADKETLLHPTSRGSCGEPMTIGTRTESTAVIKKNANNTVSATVTVKDGLPNATYEVFLTTTPSGTGCLSRAGFIRTNGQGNDSLRVSAPLRSGDTGAFVRVVSLPPAELDFLQTAEQAFGTK